MTSPSCALVCIGERADPALRDIAAAQDCELIQVAHAAAAHRLLVGRPFFPRTIIVQVAKAPGEPLNFIRQLRASVGHVPVIAAVTECADGTEHAVWEAGATCCLFTSSPGMVERLLAEVLAHAS